MTAEYESLINLLCCLTPAGLAALAGGMIMWGKIAHDQLQSRDDPWDR